MFYAHISREYMPWGSSGQKSKCFCLGGHFDQKCPFRVRMKINLSYPATGCQKLINIVVELKVLYNYNLSLVYETVGSTPFISGGSALRGWGKGSRPTPLVASSRQ